MKTVNVKCPVCGKINYNLFLEETNGWMECDRCGSITKDISHVKKARLPHLAMRAEAELLRLPGRLG